MLNIFGPISISEKIPAAARAKNCDQCNAIAWVASVFFLVIIVCLLIPDWLRAEGTGSIALLQESNIKIGDEVECYSRPANTCLSTHELESVYQRAVAIASKFSGLESVAATTYILKNDIKRSAEYFNCALGIESKNAPRYGDLTGSTLAIAKNNVAITPGERVIELKPTREVYGTLGSAYQVRNDLRTLIAFQRARDLGDARSDLQDKLMT